MFRLLGITDEICTCDLCGKTDLKCTMALENLDTGEQVHYGRDCGAMALGWKVGADRAQKIANGTARFTYDQLYDATAGRSSLYQSVVGEIDGVKIEVRDFRKVPAGWNHGIKCSANYYMAWRLAA